MPSANPSSTKKKKKQLNNYLRFSGLGFQMLAIIGICTWLGHYVDSNQTREFPLFTVILSLFGVGASLYLVFKEVNNSDND